MTQEMHQLRACTHPNVVQVLGYIRRPENMWDVHVDALVLEKCEQDLADFIAARKNHVGYTTFISCMDSSQMCEPYFAPVSRLRMNMHLSQHASITAVHTARIVVVRALIKQQQPAVHGPTSWKAKCMYPTGMRRV
jgi:hypothetical protein